MGAHYRPAADDYLPDAGRHNRTSVTQIKVASRLAPDNYASPTEECCSGLGAVHFDRRRRNDERGLSAEV